jgi:small conductance mechanosensitive channel
MEAILQKIWELTTIYGIKVLAALVIFIVGRWIAKGFRKLINRVLEKRNVDLTLVKFLGNLTYIILLTFFVVAALGQLGIQTTSFIAIIGAAGLAIGLAMQGSLANFAAGFLMIIFHPFKVGDFIEGAGVAGTVEEIQIFTTQLKTPDNKTIIIPNSKISGDNIVNYTTKGTRRVDMVVGIGYESDIDKAREILEELVTSDERVLKDPAHKIGVVELADSSVNFVVRPWVNLADYWDVWFDLTEKVKKRFDEAGISIPFPQRDIHVYEHKE